MIGEAPDAPFTLAVFGLGSIGMRHVRNALRLGPKIVGYEPNAGRADAARALGIEVNVDCDHDAAIIATPASERLSVLIKTNAERVLFEKPLARTEAEALVLKDVAKDGAVGFNLRFLPTLRILRAQVRGMKFGRPLWARVECSSYAPDWRPTPYAETPSAWRKQGGGALRECSHELDLVRWIFGEATVLRGILHRTNTLAGDSEDVAWAALHTGLCPLVEVHLDLVRRDRRRRIEVNCENGTAVWDIAEDSQEEIDESYVSELRAFFAPFGWTPSPHLASIADGVAACRLADQIEQA